MCRTNPRNSHSDCRPTTAIEAACNRATKVSVRLDGIADGGGLTEASRGRPTSIQFDDSVAAGPVQPEAPDLNAEDRNGLFEIFGDVLVRRDH
jgi:hypothetical protein